MQKPSMFYGAPPRIFEKARELRKITTPAEQLLWKHLQKKQLAGHRFRRQHPLSRFIVDFYCHTAKLVVEVDGGFHNIENQKKYDLKRTEKLERFGITVIRFTNEQVEFDIEGVLEEITSCLTGER